MFTRKLNDLAQRDIWTNRDWIAQYTRLVTLYLGNFSRLLCRFETAFDIGTAVVIHWLTSEAGKLLNWRCGNVARGLDPFSGWVGVIIGGEDVRGQRPRSILPVNLRLLGPNTRGVHIKRALRDPELTCEAWVDIPVDEALGVSMRKLESDFGALHFYWPPARQSLQATDTIHSLGVSPGQTFGRVAVFPVSPHAPTGLDPS